MESVVSIVSVCHGRWSMLKQSWPSWLKQTQSDIHYVIVESGIDRSPEELLKSNNSVTIARVSNSAEYRPSFLRNVGSSASRANLLLFVDSDIVLRSDWVELCVNRLGKYDLVINQSTYEGKDGGGAVGTLGIQRWLFERIRGYNENLDYAWGYEDTDLMLRAQKAGGTVSFYPADSVRHIPHDDKHRSMYFADNFKPRSVSTVVEHMLICAQDNRVHPYMANLVRRLAFPSADITLFSNFEGKKNEIP